LDNLTHTATGLFLARAGLKKWSPGATAIVILAANAPDIDVVTSIRGALNYLHYHRHLTHSLVAMPVMAILPVLLVALVRPWFGKRFPRRFGWAESGGRPVHWVGAFCAAMIAVASHLLLDLTNAYGVRLLLPFSGRWMQLDLTSVVDAWIWAIFALCLIGPLINRLVGHEITSGSARVQNYGRGFAWFALCFLMLYCGARYVLHARAVATIDSRMYQDALAVRVAAIPNGVNPLRWGGLIETADFWVWANVDLLDEFDPTRAGILSKAAPQPAIDAARATPEFQEFLRFAQFPLWRISPVAKPENGHIVQVLDLRFGNPTGSGFMVSALVNPANQVVETHFRLFSRAK
jgi:inner membrane protein